VQAHETSELLDDEDVFGGSVDQCAVIEVHQRSDPRDGGAASCVVAVIPVRSLIAAESNCENQSLTCPAM